jgi:tetratricopeptide (TPR) repeat protein
VLAIGDGLPEQIEASRVRRQSLESWLASFSKDELLAELLEILDEDRNLRQRFELRALSADADAAAVRRAVMKLLVLSDDEYIGADVYADDVDKAVAVIDELIKAGKASEAVDIAYDAIVWLTDSLEFIDESWGSVDDAVRELFAVHLRACQADRPEAASLGTDLAELLLQDQYSYWPDLDDYRDLLGAAGVAAVRQHVADACEERPASWRARDLMESILRDEGDVDGVVALHAANLDSHGRSHFLIARELDGAGRGAEALGWAERGVREAAGPDHQLVEYLAGRYAATGRHDELLALRRERFQAERTLAGYQALRRAAKDSGRWPAEREEALSLLRLDLADRSRRASWAWSGPVLIDALIDDGDVDAAWAVAEGVAPEQQRLRLADASISSRPADALAVYVTVIEPLTAMTGDGTYRQIARLLLSIRACHQALGTTAEFARYLTVLRMGQKRKRNLMKILDQNGL